MIVCSRAQPVDVCRLRPKTLTAGDWLRNILWILLACWTPVALGSPEKQPLILENLSTRDGLPQGDVMATLQDSQGFVWIGTEDGLVRFDGHEIRRYAYSPTGRGGLPGNFISSIAEDKNGDLWIGVKGGGLACWHRATDTFTVYRHDPTDPNSISSDAVRTVMVDNKGLIWIGSLDAGIDVLEPAGQQIRHSRHNSNRADSLGNDQVHALLQDRTGSIWIGTHTGLDRADTDSNTFIHYRLQSHPNGSGAEEISQIIEDPGGSLWVGTFDMGLFHIDHGGNVISHFRHDSGQETSLGNNDVRAILDDHAGHLWVGTPEGLDLLNREVGQFTHYGHDKADPDSLSDSYIMSLYRDAAGLVWIGTRAGGVSRWNPHSWELGGSRPDWLDSKLVTAFADGPDNHLWISSVGGGLVQLDVATGASRDLDSLLQQRNALGDRRVMSLHEDRRGVLWIGTMTNGLKKLADGKITSIPVAPGDTHGLSAAGIMSIYEARNGLLWIGTHGGGANILDPANGIVRQLPFSSEVPGSLSAEDVTSFVEDQQGNFWIGTDSGGLNLARSDGSVIKLFKHDPKDPLSLSANTIYALSMDSRGKIWIATDGGGLELVNGSSENPEDIQFHHVSHAEGLSSDTIYSVLPDSTGRLWLSGNAGLMRYDPESHAVKTYHREQGLQGEEFDSGAYYRTRDGRLCFGGPGGFNIFDPSQLTENNAAPRVALTHLDVLGAPVQSPIPYWLMHRIELNHRANIVSLDFAVLDFASPNRNQVAYRMAGLTDDWINLGALRRVTLTNLEAGDHVLEVRVMNADSVWSTTPLRLTIHKEAAPWRSASAYTMYATLLLGMIVLGLRAQRRKLRNALRAQQRLEAEVTLRTHELRETNHQLVVANQTKSNFLARMGHELRTPMNGVVGMTELLARSGLTPIQARQTQTIRSSAQALLQILNDLLDLSKAQAGKIELEFLPIDLVQIIEECASLFSVAAEAKGLELIVCPPPGVHWSLLGDALRVRQILMNLIGNALKFTEHGEIVVMCDISATDEGDASVTITVADTGIGMSDSAANKIFEPFTQADETTTRRFGGTGLGLSICREFAELMGGSIQVKSVPQVGSTFRVSLRLKTSGPRQQHGAPILAGRAVKVLTRRHAMGESLQRYLSELTSALENKGAIDAEVAPEEAPEILIVDADSCPDAVDALARGDLRANSKTIVVGTAHTIETRQVESFVYPDNVVRRPVSRNALRDALLSVVRAPTVDQASDPLSAHRGARQGHILIVEDERINAAVAEGYLAELNYSSVWVDNGAAAVARSSSEHFDIILMDLNMPGMDGFAVTARIRESERAGARTPIIALTANNAAEYRDSCLLAGMDDILSKPYSLDELVRLLRQWPLVDSHTPDKYMEESSQSLSSVSTAIVAGLRSIPSRGRSDLYASLVRLFERSATDALGQIRSALLVEHYAVASAACHKLKSGAGNVGALAFANLLASLEKSCDAKDAENSFRLHASLSAALPSLIAELNGLIVRERA